MTSPAPKKKKMDLATKKLLPLLKVVADESRDATKNGSNFDYGIDESEDGKEEESLDGDTSDKSFTGSYENTDNAPNDKM